MNLDYLRQFRIGEYAIFDLTVTFIGVVFLAPFLSKLFGKINIFIPRKNWLLLALPIGVAVHVLVGQPTPLTVNIFNLRDYYLLKILIFLLLILGLKGIKKLPKHQQHPNPKKRV